MNQYLELSSTIHGWLYGDDPELLWDLATRGDMGDILEIGSWLGRSSVILGGAAKQSGAVLYCIDTFQGDGTERQQREHRRSGTRGRTFYQFTHNIAVAELTDCVIPIATHSRIALSHLAANIRLAFIDGTHDRASVTRDMYLVKPLMVMGGLIAVHDVCADWPEVKDGFWDWLRQNDDACAHDGGNERIQVLRRIN